jgi:hypothetical protein
MGEALTKWFIFTVLLALVPIIVGALRQMTLGSAMNLEAVVAQGQLLIVTAALCAKSSGELFGSLSKERAIAKYFAGGVTMFILLIVTAYFSEISLSYAKGEQLDASVIFKTSVACYIGALLAGGSCVALSKVA